MGLSPTLPVLLGFFDGNLGTWGEGGGDGTWVSSPHFPLKQRLPRRGVCVPPVQHLPSAFALHFGTFDSGISKGGDLAKAPQTAYGLWKWRAGYRFWWEGPLKQKSFIFSECKSEHFIKKKNSHGKAVFWQLLLVRSLSSPSHNSLNGKFYG